MAAKRVYAVFYKSKQGSTTSLAEARSFAASHPGTTIYSMPWSLWRQGGPYGWDGPTFRTMGDRVPVRAPRRRGKSKR